MNRRRGIGVSPGIAIGRALVVEGRGLSVPRRRLSRNDCDIEAARFLRAAERARSEIASLRKRAAVDLGEEPAAIFDAHLLMLEDDGLVGETTRAIHEHCVNAEWALAQVLEGLMARFGEIADESYRDRARDVQDVGDRVQRALGGVDTAMPEVDGEYVLVTHDPAPSDTARLDRRRILGMAIDAGGRTSHCGIIAKSLEIPAVVGLETISREVHTGDLLIVDGGRGEVVISPTSEQVADFETRRKRQRESYETLLQNREMPCVTADGFKLFLQANIDFPDEVDNAVGFGAEGIGLYRSEFLFLNAATRGLPSEEEQLTVYRTLAERVYPRSAIVRTIDFGGGKVTPQDDALGESNPILGMRAIRYCLRHPDVFKTQLRALLRASVHGRLKIMFPLVSSVVELREAKRRLEEAKEELRSAGTRFNESLNVGIMIEVPSAALTADLLAREVDFFSIGTNDLIQFLLAVDRDNPAVSYLYEPMHPAVLRTLRSVVAAAHAAGIRVGICGEMASEPQYVPLLVGLGLDELSMNTVSIPAVKDAVRALRRDDAAAAAEHALNLATAAEVEAFLRERFPPKF